VQDVPAAPSFSYPSQAITRTTAELDVHGWAPAFTTLRLYDDGGVKESIQMGPANGWNASLNLSDDIHTLAATATDDLGQVSPPSATVLVTVDTQPPVAHITALTPYQNQATFDLSWSGSDPAPGTGVRDYDVQHSPNGVDWMTLWAGTTSGREPYANATEGTHYFRARARDRAGNAGAFSDEVSTVVDWSAPQVSVEAIYSGGAISVTWSAIDTIAGVAGYDLDVRMDDGDWETLLNDAQDTSYAYTGDYARRYAFRVTATDNVGNVGQGEANAATATMIRHYLPWQSDHYIPIPAAPLIFYSSRCIILL